MYPSAVAVRVTRPRSGGRRHDDGVMSPQVDDERKALEAEAEKINDQAADC